MIPFFKKKVTRSISRFLIVGVLSFTTIYISAIYYLSQHQSIEEIEELFDAQLAHSSFILLNLLSESVSTIDQSSAYLPVIYHGFDDFSLPAENTRLYQKKMAYQIYNEKDKLIVKSGSSPSMRFASKQLGFSNANIDGETWRVFSLYDDDWHFWLHVGESASIRDELAYEIAKQTLWPGLALLPFALLFLTIIIRLALKPIKQLTFNIKKRDPKNLTAIQLEHTPKEVEPVIDALNRLFSRLSNAIEREQRLTADAAHELRTPLSVVMLHAQNAMVANSDEDRDASLKELEQGIKRVSRLLEQLLTLSKVSPETIPKSSLVFYPLCQEIMAQMAVAIMNKQQEIELYCEPQDRTSVINGSEFLLEILLRNLIENAREYAPEQGLIRISITHEKRYLNVVIEDSGIGVNDKNLTRLADRFYREHQNKGRGAGLGLYLVKSIVDFHGGNIQFSRSELGGLAVRVALPVVR